MDRRKDVRRRQTGLSNRALSIDIKCSNEIALEEIEHVRLFKRIVQVLQCRIET